ncbi:SDR family NAD(P)-dependent oxidoreductase [Haematospirillum sp. 15-248]|uniref:SDR family NAD(P)-dependent oxidoreductase n=1 Tax=Haematospirillum sp. 15-248 TaxID=2723107 RepID=UPI001438F9AF|nr:SDR family NAD(P)-dependent oxidoreductase [Haematospirillum sp. 15-248]NKD87634.1 SDR family NAD(P)-dependent oxidoreductase [Haematospirillum sp. 15-248]
MVSARDCDCSADHTGIAVVIGASGTIGHAVSEHLSATEAFESVIGLSRSGSDSLDLLSEDSIARSAERIAKSGKVLRLVFDATGFLHGDGVNPEKTWRDLNPVAMAHAFAINAIGPALLMKHFLPRLPRRGRSVFATLSAKVGSIGDNKLGGWYSYRASKAALNQLVRTASIELARTHPDAICVALHPGTVASRLSDPFRKDGLDVVSPDEAAARLVNVVSSLDVSASGQFLDYRGCPLPW